MDVIVEEVTQVWPGRGGADIVALERFTHRFASRRFSCLLGPSGCGKSTLLQIVGGLEPATSGKVRIFDPARPREPRAPGAGSVMVWQSLNLFPWRSVLDNVAFGLEMQGMPRRERRERARALVASVGLTGFEDYLPGQLSGGMRQRVALARALAQDAEVLLMDEPFGALDAMTRDLLHDELDRIWAERGLTVLFVTHNVREAVRLGDRVVVLSSRPGRVIDEFAVPIRRPRRIDSAEVAGLAATITDRLRGEMIRHGR
jgi:NitT/TauT family transport system ATP-binding protein